MIVLMLIAAGCQTTRTLPYELQEAQAKALDGDAEAQFRLAAAYDFGSGVPIEHAEAVRWYTLSAEQGFAEAQNSLGSLAEGDGRYTEALKWYTLAADQGLPLAINNIGYLYDLGLDVEQDSQKAQEYYLRSANLGWAEAMFNLANMYGAGELGEVDLYQAYLWCLRSQSHALPGWTKVQQLSGDCLDHLATRLTDEQLERGVIEARAWVPASRRPAVPPAPAPR